MVVVVVGRRRCWRIRSTPPYAKRSWVVSCRPARGRPRAGRRRRRRRDWPSRTATLPRVRGGPGRAARVPLSRW